MMGIFTTVRNCFFAPKKRDYNAKKSLIDNFNQLCTLSFPIRRSKETQELAHYLKHCSIIPTHHLFDQLAVFELAKLALTHWLQCHQATSTRVLLIKHFYQQLVKQQEMLAMTHKASVEFLPVQLKRISENIEDYLQNPVQKNIASKLTSLLKTYTKKSLRFSFGWVIPVQSLIPPEILEVMLNCLA